VVLHVLSARFNIGVYSLRGVVERVSIKAESFTAGPLSATAVGGIPHKQPHMHTIPNTRFIETSFGQFRGIELYTTKQNCKWARPQPLGGADEDPREFVFIVRTRDIDEAPRRLCPEVPKADRSAGIPAYQRLSWAIAPCGGDARGGEGADPGQRLPGGADRKVARGGFDGVLIGNRPKSKGRTKRVQHIIHISAWRWDYSFGINERNLIDGPFSDWRYLEIDGRLLQPALSSVRTAKIVCHPSFGSHNPRNTRCCKKGKMSE
jgi:hypothetical protein